MFTSSLIPWRSALAVLVLGAALGVAGCGFFETSGGPKSCEGKTEVDAGASQSGKADDGCSPAGKVEGGEPDCCCEGSSDAAKPTAAAEGKNVQIKEASFKAVTEFVKAQKGKVVVVDVWGTFCVPCKEEFHNLVEIHNRHAKDGAVCVSVAVNSEAKDALTFLKSKKATFTNFVLDEDQSTTLAEKWDIKSVPAVFVYDRQGKEHRFTMDDPDNQFTYKDVKGLLAKLLAKK